MQQSRSRCLFSFDPSSLMTAAAALALGVAASSDAQTDPFADAVIDYTAGVGANPGFDDPAAALGSPTRITAPGNPFGGPVTPFQAPFGPGELVTVGAGGSLTVAFDEPITDDAANPFGIDLLVFGNAFFVLDFSSGTATGDTFGEAGRIEVSADGVDFFAVPDVFADGDFPTLGFQDTDEPFPSSPGSIPTDFTRPVDPTFDPTAMTTAQIVAAYAGSGGGAGVDIGSVGLSEVSFVRIINDAPGDSGVAAQIDGFADVSAVPEPASAAALAMLGGVLLRRRR